MNKGPMKGGPKGPMPGGRKIDFGMLKRVLKMLFEFYPVLAPIAVVCILISAAASALPPIFMQQVIAATDAAANTATLQCPLEMIAHAAGRAQQNHNILFPDGSKLIAIADEMAAVQKFFDSLRRKAGFFLVSIFLHINAVQFDGRIR